MKNVALVLQGSFPGGRPHSSVLLNAGQGYSSLAESTQVVQALLRHPNNLIYQLKQASFKRENLAMQCYSENNNVKAYPLNISRLNLQNEGRPIEEDVLQLYEGVFNKNLCGVKIHTGNGEAESIGALAFTAGNDIYFASDRYNPHTPQGQRLLGHELAHVIQQKQGRVVNPYEDGIAVISHPGLEAEAERMGTRIGWLCKTGTTIQKAANSSEDEVEFFSVNASESNPIEPEKIAEVRSIIENADNAEGFASSTKPKSMLFLEKVMTDGEIPDPGSQGTYGTGCLMTNTTNYALYTLGSEEFRTKVDEVSQTKKAVSETVTVHDLGTREARVHAEVEIIKAVPGVESIYTTQNACIFCYGLMVKKGLCHQAIRKNPFPQKWTHPTMNFALSRINPQVAGKKTAMMINWKGEEACYIFSDNI